MKKLQIEWRHYVKEGKTCERCAETGDNLSQVLIDIREEYAAKGIMIELKETELAESQMAESNMILVNDIPIDELIYDAKAQENNCCSCGDLIGKQTNCRTLCYQDKVYEAISPEIIRLAIENSL